MSLTPHIENGSIDSTQNVADSPNNMGSMATFEALLVSLLQQQQRTNDLMLKFMQKCDPETKPIIAKPVHFSVSDLPKFSETISSDEAFRYLGTSNLRDLNESDRVLVRAFKFISFRKRFSKLTGSLPESVQLQHLYCDF